MKYDVILEGNAYVNHSFQRCCIGIEDGVIKAVKKNLTGGKKKVFSKKIILPGGIDIHVHFRDPGFPQKETFTSGSTAAAFGGITSAFDMPNTKPQTTTLKTIKEKKEMANKSSIIDFGLYAGICDQNIDDLKKLQDLVHGFKVYLGSTTNALKVSDMNISRLFSQQSVISKPVLFHAEDNHCLEQHKAVEHSLYDHHKQRPISCEMMAIKKIINQTPCSFPIHFCHISSEEAMQRIVQSKNPVSRGITPHHSLLHIDKKSIDKPTWFKVNPPLRTKKHQEYLFNAVRQGYATILESDHAPHTIKEKETDFQQAPSGIPGVETMFPLFLYLALNQHLSIERLLYLLCENPATLLKINKGKITVGNDADFIIIDPKKQEKIQAENLHSKAEFSPFEDMPAIFPQHVFLRGCQIIEDKVLTVKNGYGKSIQQKLER